MSNSLVRVILLGAAILCVAHAALPQNGKNVDFCDLFNDSTPIDRGTVRTEAYMSYSTVSRVDGGDPFLYSPNCNNADHFAVTEFTEKISKGALTFFSTLPDEKNYILKLIVTGKFRSSYIPLYGHLSWGRSQFEIESIEKISDVSTDPKLFRPDHDAEAPSTELAKHLLFLNSEIVLNLVSGTISEQITNSLHPSFILSDSNGNVFDLDQSRSISLEKLFAGNIEGFDRRVVQQPKVEIIGDNYVATGLFWLEDTKGSKKILEYKNIFRRRADTFVLMKTNLRTIPN